MPFLKTLTYIYDANFIICEYILKDRDIKFSWISKGLKKSSKTKQRLYIKFLRTKTLEDESKYKNHKSLFKKLRKKAKTAYYSNRVATTLKNFEFQIGTLKTLKKDKILEKP